MSNLVLDQSPDERLETVPLALLEPVQCRITTNGRTVDEYAEAYREGKDLGPGRAVREVQKVKGREKVTYYLWDGIHRKQAKGHATEKPEDQNMKVLVRDGTRRDALKLSLGANATHGLQRSDDDKRHAVNVCLHDPEWSKWSNREIARICAVGHSLVDKCRRLFDEERGLSARAGSEPVKRLRRDRHGGVSEITILARSPRERDRDDPPAPAKAAPAGKAKPQPEVVLDARGEPVPDGLKDVFGDPSVSEAVGQVNALRDAFSAKALVRGLAGKVKALPFLKIDKLAGKAVEVEAGLAALVDILEAGWPHAPCPSCRGSGCDDCYCCGHVPKWKHEDLTSSAAA